MRVEQIVKPREYTYKKNIFFVSSLNFGKLFIFWEQKIFFRLELITLNLKQNVRNNVFNESFILILTYTISKEFIKNKLRNPALPKVLPPFTRTWSLITVLAIYPENSRPTQLKTSKPS